MANLISVDDLKTFLQVTGTASDTLITLYRDMVEADIDAYVGRQLTEGTFTEVLKYKRSLYDNSQWSPMDVSQSKANLFVKNTPVSSLTFTDDGATVTSTDYNLYEGNGVIELNSYRSDEDKHLQATYVAGYTTATAPIDLQNVVRMGVRALFTSNSAASSGKQSSNVKSKKIKDFSVSYASDSGSYISDDGSFKPWIKANSTILNRYKRVNI